MLLALSDQIVDEAEVQDAVARWDALIQCEGLRNQGEEAMYEVLHRHPWHRPIRSAQVECPLVIKVMPSSTPANPAGHCGEELRQSVKIVTSHGESEEVAERHGDDHGIAVWVPDRHDAERRLLRPVWNAVIRVG